MAADARLHPQHALQPAPAQQPGQERRVRDCQGKTATHNLPAIEQTKIPDQRIGSAPPPSPKKRKKERKKERKEERDTLTSCEDDSLSFFLCIHL